MRKSLYKKGLVLFILLLFVVTGVIPLTIGITEKNITFKEVKSPGYIQNLIDNASTGDTIYVPSGIYYENIVIDKSISLVGEDKNTTIIDGNRSGDVVYVTADWVNISGFTIQHSGIKSKDAGIEIESDNNNIYGNIICFNNEDGMRFNSSNSNSFIDNFIHSNQDVGIYFIDTCSNNIVKENTITNNTRGISFPYGAKCINNLISSNNISYNNYRGIGLGYQSLITISNNTISNNGGGVRGGGIYLGSSSKRISITGNTISNHDRAIEIHGSNNIISFNTILNNSYGLELRGFRNIINRNIISNNVNGIILYGSISNKIKENNISNNSNGIDLEDSLFNLIQKNNLINKYRDAFFTNSFLNRWKRNYWNESGIIKKTIPGIIEIIRSSGDPSVPPRVIIIPMINFDWHPAKEPYDIEV